MTAVSGQLRRFVLLVLCVMLLGALAPTVSRSLAWSQGSEIAWLDVCTSEGAKQIPLELNTDHRSIPGGNSLDHCGLCVLASDRMLPLAEHMVWQGIPAPTPVMATVRLASTLAILHWTVHSRAPPAHA